MRPPARAIGATGVINRCGGRPRGRRDIYYGSRNECVGRELRRYFRDLFRFADPINEMQTGERIGVFNAVAGVDRRSNDARRDGVDAYVVLAELGRQLNGECMNGALAGDRCARRKSAQSVLDKNRPDIDDCAATDLTHMGNDGLAQEERALEVDR